MNQALGGLRVSANMNPKASRMTPGRATMAIDFCLEYHSWGSEDTQRDVGKQAVVSTGLCRRVMQSAKVVPVSRTVLIVIHITMGRFRTTKMHRNTLRGR